MQIKITSNEKKPIQIRLIAHKNLPKKIRPFFSHGEDGWGQTRK
jgi:hypothetical protein